MSTAERCSKIWTLCEGEAREAEIVGRGMLWGGTRFVAAAAVATAGLAATGMTAFAASYSFSTTALPPSPFHLVVGDELTVSEYTPVLPSPPAGMVYVGTRPPDPPGTDNGAVLAPLSSGVDAAGVARTTFQAAHAGTAHVMVTSDTPCLMSIPSTATTTVTTTISSSSTTTTRTSSSTTTAGGGACPSSIGPALAVIVDASVHGASTTVPAAGAASVPWAGVGVLFAGMAVVVAVLARRDTRKGP